MYCRCELSWMLSSVAGVSFSGCLRPIAWRTTQFQSLSKYFTISRNHSIKISLQNLHIGLPIANCHHQTNPFLNCNLSNRLPKAIKKKNNHPATELAALSRGTFWLGSWFWSQRREGKGLPGGAALIPLWTVRAPIRMGQIMEDVEGKGKRGEVRFLKLLLGLGDVSASLMFFSKVSRSWWFFEVFSWVLWRFSVIVDELEVLSEAVGQLQRFSLAAKGVGPGCLSLRWPTLPWRIRI